MLEAVQLEKKVVAALAKKNFKEALSALRELIRMKPYELDLQLRAADLLAEMKEYDKAFTVYERVAENYARTGQPLKAIKVLKAIQRINPSYGDISNFMADRYAGRAKEEAPDDAIPPPPPEDIPMDEEVEEVSVDEVVEEQVETVEHTPVKRVSGGPAKTTIYDPALLSKDSKYGYVPTSEVPQPPVAAALPSDVNMNTFEKEFAHDTNQMLEKLPRHLPKIPLFSDMGKTAFKHLLDTVDHVIVQPGNDIVIEGEKGDSLYIVLDGSVEVLKNVNGAEIPLAEIPAGDFFGEMALLGNTERQATVRAVEETELLCLSKKHLALVAQKSPSVVKILRKSFQQRLLKNLLKTSPLFDPFDHKTKKLLVEKFKYRRIVTHETVIEEGAKSDGLYVIMIGEMEVKKRKAGGGEKNIAKLKAGDVFGEISLLTRGPTIASVVALKDTEVLRLPAKAFNEIILTHPQVLEFVSKLSETRIADTESKMKDMTNNAPIKTGVIV